MTDVGGEGRAVGSGNDSQATVRERKDTGKERGRIAEGRMSCIGSQEQGQCPPFVPIYDEVRRIMRRIYHEAYHITYKILVGGSGTGGRRGKAMVGL